MADNSNARFRPSDPFGRGTGPSAPANDPLAELARLIGQNDPFAEFGNRPQGQPPEQGSQGAYDNSYPTQQYQPHVPPRFGVTQPPPPDDWPGSQASAHPYQQPDPYGVPPPMRPV